MADIPRCAHGNIILGCPHEDCPEQNAYVAVMRDRYEEWYAKASAGMFPMDSDSTQEIDLTRRQDML